MNRLFPAEWSKLSASNEARTEQEILNISLKTENEKSTLRLKFYSQ